MNVAHRLQRARSADGYFRAIFNRLSDAVLLLEADSGRVIDANPAACRLLGYSPAELLSEPAAATRIADPAALRRFADEVFAHGQGWSNAIAYAARDGRTLAQETAATPFEMDRRRLLLCSSRAPCDRRSADRALRQIVEGTASVTGEGFFHALVRHLAESLGVNYAFVAEIVPEESRARTLACWWRGASVENFEYDLHGTPCEPVSRGEEVYYTSGIGRFFPTDRSLQELGIESYFGVPLRGQGGDQLGHLAVLDDRAMTKDFRGMALLRIFAARAGAELDRRRAEQAAAHSERRLAGILATATDAIVTFDEQGTIQLFNAAAEKVFRCDATTAIGTAFDRLLSRHFANLLKGYCLAVRPGTVSNRQLWAPQGLVARRRDGEEFPVEATISPLEVEGRRLYTVILRDVTERQRAEQTLRQLQSENVYFQEAVKGQRVPDAMVVGSRAMRDVMTQVERVADSDCTVLLLGETGTGKGLVARFIHERSRRRERLLVVVNCAALPAELVESELFGHEKGAFTGAAAQRKGRFELADGGTIFLDEVGELPAGTQAKLLRVLQEQEFERLGGSRSLKVDVRVIAASNRDLAAMVRCGTFRSDLYYRLNVFPVELPPLRARGEDIEALARQFVDRFAKKLAKPVKGLSPSALSQLQGYDWPGNVRELQNVIERAVILAQSPVIDVDAALGVRAPGSSVEPATGKLRDVERSHINKVLDDTGWVIEGPKGAAGVLGLKPSTLRSRIRKLGIRRPGAAA